MSQSPVVLVTGASRGIGAALVQEFQKAGWKVAACARSFKTTELERESILRLHCDVTQKADAEFSVDQAIKTFGRIDALVNNAGLSGDNPLDPESSDDLWHDIINVNLHGTYYFSKGVIPHLPEGSGRIINIASVLALKGVAHATAYCAAKHAVLGFTRALSRDLAPKKITVNAICPGWTRTDMAEARMTELGMSESDLATSVPLGRFVEPEEIAKTALFLTSESASNITGQAFTVDGGFVA